MGMEDFKKPRFIYLDKGIVGTFIAKHKSVSEPGFVHIEYIPDKMGLFHFPKKTKLKNAIREEHLFMVHNNETGDPGIEPVIMYVRTAETGSNIRFMDEELHRKLGDANDEIKRLKVEVATSNKRAKEAVSSLGEGIASSKEALGKRSVDPFGSPIDRPFRTGFDRRGFQNTDDFEEI